MYTMPWMSQRAREFLLQTWMLYHWMKQTRTRVLEGKNHWPCEPFSVEFFPNAVGGEAAWGKDGLGSCFISASLFDWFYHTHHGLTYYTFPLLTWLQFDCYFALLKIELGPERVRQSFICARSFHVGSRKPQPHQTLTMLMPWTWTSQPPKTQEINYCS